MAVLGRRHRVRLAGTALAAGTLGLAGCSVLLGPFNQCKVDADCAKVNSTQKLACVRSVCVEPCTQQTGTVGQTGTILVGAILPFTASDGTVDSRGAVRFDAIDLAIGEVNQRQGIGGKTFGAVVCDSFNDATTAQKEADYLMSLGAKAIISSGTSETLAEANDTVPADVLLVSSSATAPEIASLPAAPSGTRLVWRTAASDAIQAKVAANQLLANAPPPNNLAALYTNEAYGQDLYTEFQKDYSRTQQSFPFPPGGDVTSAVNQADAIKPDMTLVIALSNDPKSILDAAAKTASLSKSKWFFTDGAKNQALISSLADPALVEGALGTAPAAPAGTVYDNFRSRYLAQYGVDPNGYSYVANTYDAMYCIALASAWALGSGGSGSISGDSLGQGMGRLSMGAAFDLTPDQFTAARAALQTGTSININGVSGPLDFDATTGEAPASIQIWTITGGQIVNVTVVPPP
jgi:branched-chain amino acid transport system substrate-binding protein